MKLPKLAAFDMDGTLIQGRLVFALADRFGISDEVSKIQACTLMAGHEKTKAIARTICGPNKRRCRICHCINTLHHEL